MSVVYWLTSHPETALVLAAVAIAIAAAVAINNLRQTGDPR